MWIHRTPEEIAEVERRHRLSRYNPTIPLFIAFAIGCFDTAMRWAGFRGKFIPWGSSISLTEAIWRLPVLFIIVFPIAYAYRIFRRQPPPRDGTLICNGCFEAAARDASTQCQCGGSREPLYYWRWEPDRKPQNPK